MACGCGNKNTEVITSNIASQLIEEARRQSEQEYQETMLVSAGNAIGNASSGETAQR